MRRYSLIFFFLSLNAMHHSNSKLALPTEIVISDEMGVVERIPLGSEAIQREMTVWMMKELIQQNKDLQEQLSATKKKWYIVTAGIATTVIPLVICGIELFNVTQSCD